MINSPLNILRRRWAPLLGVLLLTLTSCSAGSTISSRPVQHDPLWFVRLDGYTEYFSAQEIAHDHPVEWTEAQLNAILERLLLQERSGLMESPRSPQTVFTPDEIAVLVPALKQAFHTATTHEWVAFSLSHHDQGNVQITSGEFWVEQKQLHLVIANHHQTLPSDSDELPKIQATPIRSAHGTRGALTFDPARFVVNTKLNWKGSSRFAATELTLDYLAFLASAKLNTPGASPAAFPSVLPATGLIPAAATTTPHSPSSSSQTTGAESDTATLRTKLLTLENELTQLKRHVQEQGEELARLKAHNHKPEPPPSKKLKPE